MQFGSGQMFDRIAGRYDRLNRLMSLGMDRRWRARLVAALAGSRRVVDLATGTADVALALTAADPTVEVVGIDPSPQMLAEGRTKLGPAASRITLIQGSAEAVPLPSGEADAACISFGIRNVPDRAAGLREMARVCRPGGRVAVLELGEPRKGLLAPMARWHVHHVVPKLGAWLSGEAEYDYLQRSIAAFPAPEAFAEEMVAAGLTDVRIDRLSFDAVHLYVGTVPS